MTNELIAFAPIISQMSWLLYQFADLSAEFHYCKIQTLDHMERNQHWTLKRNQIILHIMIYAIISKISMTFLFIVLTIKLRQLRSEWDASVHGDGHQLWHLHGRRAHGDHDCWAFAIMKMMIMMTASSICTATLVMINNHYIFASKVPQHVSDEDPVFNRTLRALKSHPNARC